MTLLDQTPMTPSAAAPRGDSRLFAAGGPSFASHLERFGPLPGLTNAAALLDELQAAGLTGRGGASFPTWRKMASARLSTTPEQRSAAVVIGNGAEGEPLSSKDAVLLQRAPHLVIDGLLLAARTVSARDVYLYAAASQLAYVARAISERKDARSIVLREAPDTFVSGEASAVVNSIEHGRAIPRDHGEPLSVSGMHRRPTLVQNVETLADVALVARFGAGWYRTTGTADEPGTRLVSICGDVPRAGVIEVAGGTPVDAILSRAGVDLSTVRAVLVGGYHGTWLPASALRTPLSRRELEPFGASTGAGILMVLARGRCAITVAAGIADYLGTQSARQCGPCVNGLPAMARVLSSVAAMNRDPGLVDEVKRLAGLVTGRGSCHHPDGTARFVLSTLSVFENDVRAHHNGHCEETGS
ncbi:MAG: hypothetical protein JWO18_567 [Microbacteriaceae bacterium]|jgi:NADH:ubiquinone oxidoreductase subunit F (NADH-binding)|nr:hypothetical protein [Microbacteriaceae bacterium]